MVSRTLWLLGWASPLVGLVAVLSMLIQGTCVMARSAQQAASASLVYGVQTDRSVDIWQTIRSLVDHLSKGPRGTQQVGGTRLWTSRYEHNPCVCWPFTNATYPPYTSCLSMATLDPNAHPCTPYHPATDGWVRRPMKGLRHFSGIQKIYIYSKFYIDLDLNQDVLKTLEQYEIHNWLDWSTQAVVLEVALYEYYTACIIYMQLGFELDPSRLWRGTINMWAACEVCIRVNKWVSPLLKLSLAVHILTMILDIPRNCLKSIILRTLSRPTFRWPSKTLLINLAVLVMYLLVVVTEISVKHHMQEAWEIPREGKSVFPDEIAAGITDITDIFTLLLVVLALLLVAQVCVQTFSRLGSAVAPLVRLLAIVAVIMVPFSVALYQLGCTVNILSTLEDSVLAVIAAFLGEIDVNSLIESTQIAGLVMFFLLFAVFTLLLFPFIVEVLTYHPDDKEETPRSLQHLLHFREQLGTLLSLH